MPDTTPTTPAVWIDGDPLHEAIAAAIWDQCLTQGSILVDDPRNIAAVAATTARQVLGTTDQQPETEDDEQRADREETERDHAAGDHEHCGVTCEVEMPTEHLRNFVIAKGYPGTKGALDELLRRAADQQPETAPAGLRDRIAQAIRAESTRVDDIALADAVLAVLPAPTDRAAVLREAADVIEAAQHHRDDLVNEALGFLDNNTEQQHHAVHRAGSLLRRMADEAQQPETEAHPTEVTWIGEIQESDGLWGYLRADRDRAVVEKRTAQQQKRFPAWNDGTPIRTRTVRKVTTYTVAAEQPDTETQAQR